MQSGGDLDDSFKHVMGLDPHLLLTIFIPPLLMEAAIGLNVHVFKRVMSQCLWLAGPGVLVCIGLSMLVARFILPEDWGWNQCALFGAIVSATGTNHTAVSPLVFASGVLGLKSAAHRTCALLFSINSSQYSDLFALDLTTSKRNKPVAFSCILQAVQHLRISFMALRPDPCSVFSCILCLQIELSSRVSSL